jgi:hypothetical protein
VDAQDQDLEDEVHLAPMLAEDEVIQGVGSSDEEMEPEGENENQATKEKTLRSTRQQRITPESDVEDIAEVPQRCVWFYKTV